MNLDDIETELAFAKLSDEIDTDHALRVFKLLNSTQLSSINMMARYTGKTSILVRLQAFLDSKDIKNVIVCPKIILRYTKNQYDYARIFDIESTKGLVYDVILIDDYSELTSYEHTLLNRYHTSTKRYCLSTPRKNEWGPFGTNP